MITIDQAQLRLAVERHGLDWHYRERTESTNIDALDYFQRQQRELVAVAEMQSAGRGRRGRQWISPHAQNIYCTLGLVKSLPAQQLGLLSIVTGLALCRALIATCGISPELKWPNDLLVDGQKLGGILIETRPRAEDEYFLAVGIGLNVMLDEATRAAIGQPVTSLHLIAAEPPDRSRLLVAAIDQVVCSIRQFSCDDAGDLAEQFSRFDAFHDRPVELVASNTRHCGTNRGIDASGALRLETEQGIEFHAAAEISLVAR